MQRQRWAIVRRRRKLLSICALSLLAFLALAVVAARQYFFDLDLGMRGLVKIARSPTLQGPMEHVTRLGAADGLIALIVISSLVLWRRRRRWALAVPIVMAGTGALQYLTKWAVDRPRPNETPWGFPSGHVLSLVVFFGLITYFVFVSTTRRRWRCLAVGVGLLPVLVVAYSRLYLEMHWLTDLVGGFTVGLAYLLLAIFVVELISDRRDATALAASGESKPPAG